MKATILFLSLITAAFSIGAASQAQKPESTAKVSSDLQASLDSLRGDEMATVVVLLTQRADLSTIPGQGSSRGQAGIIRALQATAEASQAPLRAFLRLQQTRGSVLDFTPLWVVNGISVTATRDVILEIASRNDVERVSPNDIDIIETSPVPSGAEANVQLIHAPDLWAMGYSGQGVVVANMDTGVDLYHPDLLSRWRGGSNSWYDPYSQHPLTPTDLSGHGTWTMGVAVGGDLGGTSIGVAPGAQWIAVKIFNDRGRATATAIHQGFQWLLDPDGDPDTPDAPDVVNNSWAYGKSGCDLAFQADLQALRAAGIVPVFAAGNYGGGSSTSTSPANNPEAFAVGATNNFDQLYFYSSRGPSACGESDIIFPELTAPGVGILTTDLYGFYYQATGTSLAAPHVAGALALLLSAFPGLSADQQEQALMHAAMDLGSAGPDNDFGYGRLDVLGAFQCLTDGDCTVALPPPPPATAGMHVGDLDGASSSAKSSWNAVVTVEAHSDSHAPLSGVTIAGSWSSGASGSGSCTTDASGQCQITKSSISKKNSSVTFTVTGATKANYSYAAAGNHDPDGDSNGTSIVVTK